MTARRASPPRRRGTNGTTPVEVEKSLERVKALFPAETDGVQEFLRKHPALIAVLLDAYPHLARIFGTPHLTLNVVRDSEGEGEDELFAYITTTEPVDEALAKLDQFDEEWFLDQDQTEGRLNFSLEFA